MPIASIDESQTSHYCQEHRECGGREDYDLPGGEHRNHQMDQYAHDNRATYVGVEKSAARQRGHST